MGMTDVSFASLIPRFQITVFQIKVASGCSDSAFGTCPSYVDAGYVGFPQRKVLVDTLGDGSSRRENEVIEGPTMAYRGPHSGQPPDAHERCEDRSFARSRSRRRRSRTEAK